MDDALECKSIERHLPFRRPRNDEGRVAAEEDIVGSRDTDAARRGRRPALVLAEIVAVVLVAGGLTLRTVEDGGTLSFSSADPTPLGYTWSLALFLLPLLYLLVWLMRHPDVPVQRKAFGRTLLLLVPLGFVLDFLFAHTFFTFPNHGAVLGIEVPGVGGGIPIEEFIFYISGFVFVLLLYVWADGFWMAAYDVDDYAGRFAAQGGRLLAFHWPSLVWALVLLAGAVVYKKVFAADPHGFPWYWTYLLAAAFVPSAGFFGAVKRFVNWRAFSFTFLLVLLISLVWEASLAAPFGWWGYQHDAMMGWYIRGWSGLPIEAVFVWLAVTYTTIIVYEVVRIWVASGERLRDVLMG